MPRPVTELAVSDRWLDELAALRGGGPSTRHPVRVRMRTENRARQPGERLRRTEIAVNVLFAPLRIPGMPLVDLVLGRWTRPPRIDVGCQVGIYETGARPGDLPLVVVDVPVRCAAAIGGQHGEVDVRGELAPGHAVVLVLDDGEVVGCTYPAAPPPPVGAARRWAYR